MFNKDFYPTPLKLAEKMISKINFKNVNTILEPSAGKGDLLEALIEIKPAFGNPEQKSIECIEIDPDLNATLIGKGYTVIDNDFLIYSGTKQYDLILANFPFSNGDKHLLKALDILFSGQICCLINAETLKNPYTNTRKVLKKRLEDMNAEIEYIEDAFTGAQRKSDVEVALVYVNIDNKIEDVLNEGLKDDKSTIEVNINEKNEVSTSNHINDLVVSYNQTINACTDYILNYFKHSNSIENYIDLTVGGEEVSRRKKLTSGSTIYTSSNESTTTLAKNAINKLIGMVKQDYWRKLLRLADVKDKLSFKAIESFNHEIYKYVAKEFTTSNIRQFITNVSLCFSKNAHDAAEEVFDRIAGHALRDERWGEKETIGNIHYFNAWKTNKGYKISKKFIIRCSSLFNWDGDLNTYSDSGSIGSFLHDIGVVMNYFAINSYTPNLILRLAEFWKQGKRRKIETANFYISIFKKGTVHFEFKDLDILRRFNVLVCKKKGWLPMEYSNKPYNNLNSDQEVIVQEFEGKSNYKVISGDLIQNNLLQIELKP